MIHDMHCNPNGIIFYLFINSLGPSDSVEKIPVQQTNNSRQNKTEGFNPLVRKVRGKPSSYCGLLASVTFSRWLVSRKENRVTRSSLFLTRNSLFLTRS